MAHRIVDWAAQQPQTSRIPTNVLRVGPWHGGLKRDISDLLLGPNDTPAAVNVDFGVDGVAKKRRGYTKFSTSDPAGATYGRWLFPWSVTDGNNFLFYIDNDNELYYLNASSGTTLVRANDGSDITLGGSQDKGFAAMDDVAYFTSRGASPVACKFDGTTWTTFADTTLDGSGSEFPLAKALVNQHERIFAANISSGGTAYKSRVWWSNAGAAETWGTNSWIDFDPDDGQQITGLTVLGDRIIVFKQFSFYVLSGTAPNSFTSFKVSDRVGMYGSRAAAEVEGMLFWWDRRTGTTYGFDGASYDSIDDPVHDWISDNLDSSGAAYAAKAWSFNSKFYLALNWTEGGGGSDSVVKRTFVYEPKYNRWSDYDYAFQDTANLNGAMYGISPQHEGDTTPKGIYYAYRDQDVDDAGTNIDAFIESPWMTNQGDFFNQHRLHKVQLYMPGEATNPATMTVALYQDWNSTTASNSETVSNSSTLDYAVDQLAGYDSVAKSFKLKISNDSADEWQVDAVDMMFSDRQKKRGADD